MRTFVIALALTAVAFASASKVLELTDDNFAAETAKHEALLVEFYAPWCGHCKALAPKYDEAADILAGNADTMDLKIAKMDADSQKKVPGQHGVSGFPTLKLFRNGEFAEDYDGERSAEAIVAYVKKKAAQSTNKEIKTMAEFKAVTKGSAVKAPTVVGIFASKDNVDFKIFKQVVSKFVSYGIEVYHTANPSVLEALNFFSSGSAIHMYRPESKPFKITFRGTVFKQTLNDWIMENALPVVGRYHADNQKLYRQTGDHLVRLVTESEPSKDDLALLNKAAEANKNIRFAWSLLADAKDDVNAHCGENVKKCVLASEGEKSKRRGVFGLSEVTNAKFDSFIDDFLNKKLKTRVKSEPAPAGEPEAGEVATLVGTTFEKHVINSDKDVLIEFFAPWCGHCKALAPKYDQLAKDVAGDFDSLLIAKFDMTANDIPKDVAGNGYEVSGFPTIYFAPKGKKTSPIQYSGDREAAAMKKWIEEQRSK